MLDVKPAILTLEGKEYTAEFGRIKRTFLGKEDHGIFTFHLEMDFGGTGQGAGNYRLNDAEEFGKAVQAVLNFFGGSWESISGASAFALRDKPYGLIRGLMDESQTKTLIFGDWV